MILRLLHSQWAPFVESLCARQDVETAGLILAERLYGGDVLLGRHFVAIPDTGYQIRRVDQLRIDPIVLNRLVRPARDGDLSVITVHTHPGTSRPWFSAADDDGDSRLMPSLFAQMPGPHGSLVVAGTTRLPIARLWTEDRPMTGIDVRVVGQTIDMFSAATVSEPDDAWFDRQRLALGEYGQAALQRLHVAVVGLGGTGSVVFVQLAHLGVGRITAVDGDRVDASNVSRILGATSRDAIAAAMNDRRVSMEVLPASNGDRELAVRLFLAQRHDASLAEVFARAQTQVEEGADHRRYNEFLGKEARAITNLQQKGDALRDETLRYCSTVIEYYRRILGRVLFDDDLFFAGEPVCSLRVLQERGPKALTDHSVPGIGRVWMTECLWERSDRDVLQIRSNDCFRTFEELGLALTEGELVQAKLKLEVVGRSTRPLSISIRTPSRLYSVR